MSIAVTIGSATHVGMEKKENQDYHAYHIPPEDSAAQKKGILLALADGMGGYTGGSIASRVAVDTLMEIYYEDTSDNIVDSLKTAFLKANADVIAKANESIETERMGSTLTAVVIKKSKLYYAHVGDSRGYIIDENEISQFTEDHSFVASLVKAGAITEEQARTHPERNLITRAIGLAPELNVDASPLDRQIKKNLYILLCCDGLHGVVSEDAIFNAVSQFQEPDIISEKLVEKANQNGGPDNVTVLIARIDQVDLISSLTNRFMNLVR